MTHRWKTREQRCRDMLEEMAGQSMYQLAELLVDGEDRVAELEEALQNRDDEVKQLNETLAEKEETLTNLERDYTSAERECTGLRGELEALQEKYDHLKSLATILNYREPPQ